MYLNYESRFLIVFKNLRYLRFVTENLPHNITRNSILYSSTESCYGLLVDLLCRMGKNNTSGGIK